jgi:hypothetical protein
MVARELGIQVDEQGGSVLRGALFMGTAFGLGALVPILPFLILPFSMSLPIAALATGVVLFGVGVVKSRWTHRSAISSGLEVLALAAFAGIAGYLFGTCPAEPPRGRRDRRLADPFGEVDRHRIALALVQDVTEIGLDRQLVGAVTEGHERAAEWVAVDGPTTLTRPRVPKKAGLQSVTTYVQPPLAALFCRVARKVLSSAASGGHAGSSTM